MMHMLNWWELFTHQKQNVVVAFLAMQYETMVLLQPMIPEHVDALYEKKSGTMCRKVT